MKLYLVRHGEATSEKEDPRRPLSAAGRAEIERIAAYLERASAIFDTFIIQHSGKVRAQQTAEILAAHLCPAEPPRQVAGLAPNDPPQQALDWIAEAARDLMLVGHLPHLARLASLLLIRDADQLVIDMPAGAVVCLQIEHGAWRLAWLLTPALAAA